MMINFKPIGLSKFIPLILECKKADNILNGQTQQ